MLQNLKVRLFQPQDNTQIFPAISVCGVSCTYSPFHITPQNQNRIKNRALTWQIQNSQLLSFKSFFNEFDRIFWVIVKLHSSYVRRFKFVLPIVSNIPEQLPVQTINYYEFDESNVKPVILLLSLIRVSNMKTIENNLFHRN